MKFMCFLSLTLITATAKGPRDRECPQGGPTGQRAFMFMEAQSWPEPSSFTFLRNTNNLKLMDGLFIEFAT